MQNEQRVEGSSSKYEGFLLPTFNYLYLIEPLLCVWCYRAKYLTCFKPLQQP
jgi:hypothetical protein